MVNEQIVRHERIWQNRADLLFANVYLTWFYYRLGATKIALPSTTL